MFHIKKKSVYPPDFSQELRATKDSLDIISNAKMIAKEWQEFTSIEELLIQMIESTFKEPNTCKVRDELLPILVKDGTLVNLMQGIQQETWCLTFAPLSCIKRRFVSIATFDQAVTLSPDLTGILIFVLILAPRDEKKTKSGLSTAQTMASLMSDPKFRLDLRRAERQKDLLLAVYQKTNELIRHHTMKKRPLNEGNDKIINLFTGVKENVTRRLSYYKSDIMDGLTDWRTMSKVISSTFFLYFLCILPTVAFGALNQKNTNGFIDTKRALIGEGIGGLLFALFAGQPFVIIATTAPIALCNKIVYDLSISLDVPFYSLYACVGLFNAFFLMLYGILGLNSLIKFSTRSVEEIFSAFIVCCFVSDAWADLIQNVRDNYETFDDQGTSMRCVSLLFFMIKNGTLAFAVMFSRFQSSKFLNSSVRMTISDYALPLAVIIFSGISAGIFGNIKLEKHVVNSDISFQISNFSGLNPASVAVSILLGFTMSVLFFMDQGISAQLVNSPVHKLKKGNANDYDIIVVAIINIFMSLFGLPWMHGLLPHSPLHVKSLAETEDQVDKNTGRIERVIVFVRETRLAVIACHVLIVITVTCIPGTFSEIPLPVLDGLFMFCAAASIPGNSFFERLNLLLTQQSKYPPTHYVRRCEQRMMHYFTAIQVIQLIILVFVGIAAPWPYFRMTFPLLIALLIPFRHLIVPRLIGKKNIDALDSFD